MQQDTRPETGAVASPQGGTAPSGHAAMTFLLCAVYFTFTLVFAGWIVRVLGTIHPALNGALAEPLLQILLMLAGFLAIARVRVPELRAWSAVGLVRRPTVGQELSLGAVAGWAIGVVLVLPGVLLLRMHTEITWDGFHVGATAGSALILLLIVLVRQLALCGLPFRSLSRATSPLFASVAFSGVAALLTIYSVHGDTGQALVAAMAQMVFCLAAARTRAIWLGGALQLVWGFAITILFGLPSFLWPPAMGLVRSRIYGPRWLVGGFAGPEAALWAGVVLLAALIAVWRLTREYAWHYTFDPIVGGGYPMDVPPPAEHTRMQEAAERTAPLVQIGGLPTAPAEPRQNPDEL